MVSRSPRVETTRSAAGQATRASTPRQPPLTRAAILASAFLLPALTLTACTAPTHYAGIDLRAGAESAEVQALAQQAQGGSKEAQLALGIQYEEGNGLPLDVKRARKLYRMAAAATGGTIFVYVPASKKGGKGHLTPVNTGPRVEGLAEARARLNGH
jgi:hypothetical protein